MEAFYDLGKSPPTHDFLNWLYRAEVARLVSGDEHLQVRFVRGYRQKSPRDVYYTPERRDWRVQNLLMPLAWLLPSVDDVSFKNGEQTISYLNPGMVVPPILEAPKQAREYINTIWHGNIVTISIRESDFEECRNSNSRQWGLVCEWLCKKHHIRPIIILDGEQQMRDPSQVVSPYYVYYAASHNIAIKLAIMERAAMNLMTNSGPMVMALYADVPMLAWKCHVPGIQCGTKEHMTRSGFGPEHDWSTAKHVRKMFWEDDTAENIIPVLERYLPMLKEAA